MSLRDGTKKMSKSDPSDQSRINLNDDPDAIALKIRRAKTDPEPLPSETAGPGEAGRRRAIWSASTPRSTDSRPRGRAARAWRQGLRRVQGGAGRRCWSRSCRPIAGETQRLLADPAVVDAVLRDGAERAAAIADPIVAEAERLVGFLRV